MNKKDHVDTKILSIKTFSGKLGYDLLMLKHTPITTKHSTQKSLVNQNNNMQQTGTVHIDPGMYLILSHQHL